MFGCNCPTKKQQSLKCEAAESVGSVNVDKIDAGVSRRTKWIFVHTIYLAGSLTKYEDNFRTENICRILTEWSRASNYLSVNAVNQIKQGIFKCCKPALDRELFSLTIYPKTRWIEIDVFENSFDYNKLPMRLILRNHFLCHSHTLCPLPAPPYEHLGACFIVISFHVNFTCHPFNNKSE